MLVRNFGVEYDLSWFDNIYVNLFVVKCRVEILGIWRIVKK